MRDLSPTLEAAQKAATIDALAKIVLTHGASSYTYDRERILDIEYSEETYNHKAEVTLDNSDGVLTNLDLKGYKGVISCGAVASGDEYSAPAPLWVIPQGLESSPGRLACILSLIGIPNLLAEDEASESYLPDEDDTKTVKTLINEILGATLACFSHCQAYDVVWDAGYDTLADTYKPKDGFRIYVGGSRLAAFRRLMDYTGNVPRFEADGKVHILKPVTTGIVYDYEYSLDAGHTFFSKAHRRRVVIPGYIVVQSQPDDDPQYSGYAKDDGYDALPTELKKRQYKQMRLESHGQAKDIAEAILAKHQLQSDMGAADVPMNVGAELFDYVRVADSREDDYRIGNIGYLSRHYRPGRGNSPTEWHLTFSFGKWLSALDTRRFLKDLETYSDEGQNFSRLNVKDLYAENILAENCNFYWLDPDNTIDLSKIGDDLDSLPDGEVYGRVKTLHLDAGKIKLDEYILYKSGYDPTDKFDLADNDLDDIPEGTVYQRVKSLALTAGGMVVLDQVIVGTYGLVLSADISAGHIKLSACSGDIDDIGNGTIYGKIKLTDISAGHILLSSVVQSSGYRTVTDGEKSGWDDKTKVFRQSTAPTSGMVEGDIWIDTNDGDKPYTYSGSQWIASYTEIDGGHITTGTIDCSQVTVQSAGSGKRVVIDQYGLSSYGDAIQVRTEAGVLKGYIYGVLYDFNIVSYNCDINISAGSYNVDIAASDITLEANADILLSAVDLVKVWGNIELQEDTVSVLADIWPLTTTDWIGTSYEVWKRGYFEDLYRQTEHDLQHYDDIALISQMKGSKKNPGFIDPSTIPEILLEDVNETRAIMLAKLDAQIQRRRDKVEGLRGKKIIGHNARMTTQLEAAKNKQISMVEQNITKLQARRSELSLREFIPKINLTKEVSLTLGAIRQMADKLDGIEGRLGALEATKST